MAPVDAVVADTKSEAQEPMTLGEVIRDAETLTERFIKSLDVMCACGVEVEYLKDGKPVPGFPPLLRFAALRYGDLAEMTQRRKAASLALYRAEVYNDDVTAKQRFQDLHVILHRLAMKEDFAFSDPANVRNAVQLSLRRGHRADNWQPTLDQVDEIVEDKEFKEFVLDIIDIETYGPGNTTRSGTSKEGVDGAENPTRAVGTVSTEAARTTPT